MYISRPTFEIVTSPSGKKFTWRATAESWTNEYQLRELFDTKADANKAIKRAAKDFETEARVIEAGGPRHIIFETLTKHGITRSRPKLTGSLRTFGQ